MCRFNPQDGFLRSTSAMCGLMVVMHAMLDSGKSILGERHFLLYALSTAIRPRWLVCVDEKGNQVPVSVRVGTKVDTVGQAGKPRSITGFTTHNTPVLLGAEERAELASDEWLTYSSTLEGYVIVRKNPDFSAN